MSHFKTKMHQIGFRLGICPIPSWGAHSAPSNPLAGLKGPNCKGREEMKDGREGQGRVEGEERGKPYRHFFTPLRALVNAIRTLSRVHSR